MIMVKHRTSILFKLTCFLLTYHNTKQFSTIKKRENELHLYLYALSVL